MSLTITIKVNKDFTEQEVFEHVRRWVLENFQIDTDVKFEVSGKNETLKFDMEECKKQIPKTEEPKKETQENFRGENDNSRTS